MPRIRLHLKVLKQPTPVPIAPAVESARRALGQAGVDVEVATTEHLDLPDLMDLRVYDSCQTKGLTAAQRKLFENRKDVGSFEIAIFFVRSLDPPANGCSQHPDDLAGAVIAAEASTKWTLAHEIGHLLKLEHVAISSRLMYEEGTSNIKADPPRLAKKEIAKLLASDLVLNK